MDKYQEAIGKFTAPLPDKELTDIVANLIEKNFKEEYNAKTLKTIHSCIDLTSLASIDTKESIFNLVNSVNDLEGERSDIPNVAAICTYPIFMETVKQSLMAENVKIASVAGGFPSSQTFLEIKIAETALAILEGADEIDIVMNLGHFFENNYDELTEEISEIKDSCRESQLKVILETGALASAENIHKAAILSIYSGADFIKTSTGKGYPGATPEAVYTICQILKQYKQQTGKKIGIKISGGIRIAEDAVKYYCIVKDILGEEWLNSECLRFGASTLSADIQKKIG